VKLYEKTTIAGPYSACIMIGSTRCHVAAIIREISYRKPFHGTVGALSKVAAHRDPQRTYDSLLQKLEIARWDAGSFVTPATAITQECRDTRL